MADPSGCPERHRATPALGLGQALLWAGLLAANLTCGGHATANPANPAAVSATTPAAAAPAQPIGLASPAGQALLLRRQTLRADYGPLSQWFETQANLAYCGVASVVVVLNSLPLPAPAAEGYGPYRFWTQTNVFAAPASAGFVRPAVVAREGMTLEQLDGLLISQGALVQRYHGDGLTLAQFRQLLRRSLADPTDRLLANYDRRALGQAGGGHISPLAAYDPSSDRVLILDVARYRYPMVWVATADLWQAVRTVDRSSGRSRGLLTIQAAPPPPETSWPPDPNRSEPPAPAQRPGSAPGAPHR